MVSLENLLVKLKKMRNKMHQVVKTAETAVALSKWELSN